MESWCLSTAHDGFLPLCELVREHVQPLDWKPLPISGLLSSGLSQIADTARMLAAVDRACQSCASEINAGQFDLLLTTNCILSTVAPVARYVQCPSVMYVHEPCRKIHDTMPFRQWLGRQPLPVQTPVCPLKAQIKDMLTLRNARLLANGEISSAGAVRMLLTNSYFTRENVLRCYGVNSQVCYQGVDLDVFRPEHQPRESLVLGIGEYSPHKNIPFVIDCVAAMPPPRPRLIWIGNGGSRNLLHDMESLAAQKAVSFEPLFGVSDDVLVSLYNRAGVLIYAPRLEPFGLAPLEANACGLPVVAVAEGGLRETIRDGLNGFLVDYDPLAIAEAAGRVLSDHHLAGQLTVGARRWVEEKWTLRQSVDRLEFWLQKVRTGM